MIKVSESAKTKIAQLMAEEGFNIANDFVRVGVKSGGCSGLSYELKFDHSLGENDKLFEEEDVKIAVDKKSFLVSYLKAFINGYETSGGPRA